MAKKTTKRREPGDPIGKSLQRLTEQVKMHDLRLVETHGRQRIKDGPLPTQTEVGVEVEAAHDPGRQIIRIRPKFTLRVRYENDESDEPAILVSAMYQLVYLTVDLRVESIPGKVLSEFANQIGLFTAWPYWRELVHSTFSRMGLPPLVVPPLQRGQLIQDTPSASLQEKPTKEKR